MTMNLAKRTLVTALMSSALLLSLPAAEAGDSELWREQVTSAQSHDTKLRQTARYSRRSNSTLWREQVNAEEYLSVFNATRLARQVKEIDRLNEGLKGFRVLKSIEVDILEDGSLDLPDDVLGQLDLVVGSVHSGFDLSRAKQTRRLLKAMDHPHFTLLGHPTTRELGKRPPIQADWLRIIRQARQRGCFLELNSQPKRLDLPDTWCHVAKDEGVLVAISSDAHSRQGIDNLEWGVGQARRGWLTADDVLNSRSLRQLRPLLRRTM